MTAAPAIQIQVQREKKDCGIAALSMLLGVSYEDTLRATTLTDRSHGKRGLWTRTLQRIAKRLGFKLVVRYAFDLDNDYGLLRLPDHAVILRNGLVIDTDAWIYDADEYLAARRVRQSNCQLLVVTEG